jgi:hypothetical protein
MAILPTICPKAPQIEYETLESERVMRPHLALEHRTTFRETTKTPILSLVVFYE